MEEILEIIKKYIIKNIHSVSSISNFFETSQPTVWGTLTLLVNKKLWSYHKVVLDLWWAGIWLKVSIVYQFHEAKSRYLSSEPGHWFKKQLSKFSWNQSKDLTFGQIFAFCDLNVIFDNSNWIECVYILKFQIGVNSKADSDMSSIVFNTETIYLFIFCFYS